MGGARYAMGFTAVPADHMRNSNTRINHASDFDFVCYMLWARNPVRLPHTDRSNTCRFPNRRNPRSWAQVQVQSFWPLLGSAGEVG